MKTDDNNVCVLVCTALLTYGAIDQIEEDANAISSCPLFAERFASSNVKFLLLHTKHQTHLTHSIRFKVSTIWWRFAGFLS